MNTSSTDLLKIWQWLSSVFLYKAAVFPFLSHCMKSFTGIVSRSFADSWQLSASGCTQGLKMRASCRSCSKHADKNELSAVYRAVLPTTKKKTARWRAPSTPVWWLAVMNLMFVHLQAPPSLRSRWFRRRAPACRAASRRAASWTPHSIYSTSRASLSTLRTSAGSCLASTFPYLATDASGRALLHGDEIISHHRNWFTKTNNISMFSSFSKVISQRWRWPGKMSSSDDFIFRNDSAAARRVWQASERWEQHRRAGLLPLRWRICREQNLLSYSQGQALNWD